MLVKMTVRNLALDPMTNVPIIILRDESGNLVVPIWIGIFEANAIAMVLANIPTARPMTHDLLKVLMEKGDLSVQRALITDIKDGTYYALLEIQKGENTISVDCRPSDAIAIALRFNAPILVDQVVIEKSKAADHGRDAEEAEKLQDWLESLKPEDFGKYSM